MTGLFVLSNVWNKKTKESCCSPLDKNKRETEKARKRGETCSLLKCWMIGSTGKGILVNHQENILQKDLLPELMRKGERRNIIIYDEQAIFHYYSNKSLHWNVLVSQQQQSLTNFTIGITVCSIAWDLLLKIMFGYTHFYSLFFLLRKFEAAKSYLVPQSVSRFWTFVISYILINQKHGENSKGVLTEVQVCTLGLPCLEF